MSDELKGVLEKIQNSDAQFVGESRWVKNGAWQVYKIDGKFYLIAVEDQMSCWLIEETLKEITKEEVSNYVYVD